METTTRRVTVGVAPAGGTFELTEVRRDGLLLDRWVVRRHRGWTYPVGGATAARVLDEAARRGGGRAALAREQRAIEGSDGAPRWSLFGGVDE